MYDSTIEFHWNQGDFIEVSDVETDDPKLSMGYCKVCKRYMEAYEDTIVVHYGI